MNRHSNRVIGEQILLIPASPLALDLYADIECLVLFEGVESTERPSENSFSLADSKRKRSELLHAPGEGHKAIDNS
jgi:hypothetical protein